MDETKTTDPGVRPDSRFQLLTGGLLVVIVITLAGLWMMERARRARTESTMAGMRGQLAEQQKKMQTIGQMLVRQMNAPITNRSELGTIKVQWNGEKKTVLLLGEGVGKRLGFESGDVILITPGPPAMSPTTRGGEN